MFNDDLDLIIRLFAALIKFSVVTIKACSELSRLDVQALQADIRYCYHHDS